MVEIIYANDITTAIPVGTFLINLHDFSPLYILKIRYKHQLFVDEPLTPSPRVSTYCKIKYPFTISEGDNFQAAYLAVANGARTLFSSRLLSSRGRCANIIYNYILLSLAIIVNRIFPFFCYPLYAPETLSASFAVY